MLQSIMIVQCFLSLFLFILCCLSMCYSDPEPHATSGPFKTSFVSVNDCSNPSRPYLKNPSVIFHPFIQNIDGKNMLGGNFTITKDTKDAKMKIKSYIWRDGKWRLSVSFNNIDCYSALIRFSLAACNIKFDKKNCVIIKGFYSFKNMDVNQLQHIWVPSMPYGKLKWRAEMFNRDGTFYCKEFHTITEAAYYG